MKNFKFLSVAFVAMDMFVCNTAYAQYYSRPAGSTSSKSYSYTYDEARDRNIVELEFALGHFGNKVQSCGLQSLTYSFIHAFGLSSSKPWFAELGAGMEYSWTDGKLGCLHNLAFVIPVRVSYEIETAGSLRIVPMPMVTSTMTTSMVASTKTATSLTSMENSIVSKSVSN